MSAVPPVNKGRPVQTKPFTNPNNNLIPGTPEYAAQQAKAHGGSYTIGGVTYDASGNPVRTTQIDNNVANRQALDKAGISYTLAGQNLFVNSESLQSIINSGGGAIGSTVNPDRPNPEGYSKDALITNQTKDIFQKGPATQKEWNDLFLNAKIAGQTEKNLEQRQKNLEAEQTQKGGGIETPQSAGKSYGWGITQNVRNTNAEKALGASEAARAAKYYKSTSNPDYASGGQPLNGLQTFLSMGGQISRSQFQKSSDLQQPLGGVATALSSKLSDSLGWVATGQNRRGSQQEEQVKAFEALRGQVTEKGNPLIFTKPPSVSNAKNQKAADSFDLAGSNNTKYEVNFFESVGLSDSLAGGTKPTSSSGVLSQKEFVAKLSQEEKNGAVFDIYTPSGTLIKTTSGQRSFFDYEKAQLSFGQGTYLITRYPKAEAELISSIKANPDFYATKGNSYWENLGKEGLLSSKGMQEVNTILYTSWLKSPQHQQAVAEDRALRTELTKQESTGQFTTFSILDKNGKVLETLAGGPRTYHDYLQAQQKYGLDISIKPNYAFSTSEYFGALSGPSKGTGELKAGDVLSSIGKSAYSDLVGMYALGVSIWDFGNSIKSSVPIGGGKNVTLPIGYNENVTKDIEAATLGQIPFIGGLKFGSLSKGKAEFRDVPLSQRGQTIIKSANSTDYTSVQLGLQNSTASEEAGSAIFAGMMTGALLWGLKGLSPIKTLETGYKVELANGQIKPVYSGLTIGYDIFGKPKPLIGFAGGKFKVGKPTAEEYLPEGSKQFIQNPGRGYEPSTPQKAELGIITDKGFQARKYELNPSNREKENSGLELQLQKDMETISNTLAGHPEITNKVFTNTIKTGGREGITPQVIEGGLVGTAKKQGPLSFFNIFTGKAGKIQGSTGLPQFLREDLANMVKPHDIDVIKSNPLGLLEEYQAENLAKYVNAEIQRTQGILPQEGTSFHATDLESARSIVSTGIDTEASARGSGFFTMDKADVLGWYGDTLLKIKYEPKDVLFYKSLSKNTRENLASDNWLEFQNNMIDFAKSKGFSGVTKPYYNTAKGAGKSPNADLNEIIFFSTKPIKSTDILEGIQGTTVEGRRIFTQEGEKAIEFVTRKDETGSSAKTSGSVYGTRIDSTAFKPFVEGTKTKVKTTSGVFQLQTNVAKNAFQTRESAIEQSATEKQLGIIGEGEYFGPELFAGKAIVRPYLQVVNFMTEAVKSGNKGLIKEGFKALEAAHRTRYYQADNPKTALFDWGESEKALTREQEKQSESSTLVESPSSLSSITKGSARGLLSSGFSSVSRSVSDYSFTSKKPATSGKSSVSESNLSSIINSAKSPSVFSAKSASSIISKSSSSFSSKSSTKSGSGKSGKSGSSSSSLSGGSSGSNSIFSGGPSGSSFSGGPSGPSGSAFSGGPSSSPFSGYSIDITSITPKKIPKAFSLYNYKTKNKGRSKNGPTRLYELGYKNIFFSGLDIKKRGWI